MSDPAHAHLRFTRAQRNHLEMSLGHILTEMEEAVVWFRKWPLPEPRQEKTLRDLEALDLRIREVAESLGLRPSAFRPDPLKRMEALISEWWTTALDCRWEVLRGYGQVDPSTGRVLNPLVEGLAADILRVGQAPEDDPRIHDSSSDQP